MNLSPHFTVAELTASNTAKARRIDNSPPPAVVAKLRLLCDELLEPVRRKFGLVTINSGYRSPRLNAAVGSASTSQHLLGEAADFEVPGVANGTVAAWCRDNLDFGQLILEAYTPGQPSSGWVHISLPRIGKPNRQVLTATPGSHGMVYTKGLKL